MSIRIRLTSVFAERIEGIDAVDVDATTVESALRTLTDRHPELSRLVWISAGVLNPVVAVFVNDRLVRPDELGVSVESGDEIHIITAVSGG